MPLPSLRTHLQANIGEFVRLDANFNPEHPNNQAFDWGEVVSMSFERLGTTSVPAHLGNASMTIRNVQFTQNLRRTCTTGTLIDFDRPVHMGVNETGEPPADGGPPRQLVGVLTHAQSIEFVVEGGATTMDTVVPGAMLLLDIKTGSFGDVAVPFPRLIEFYSTAVDGAAADTGLHIPLTTQSYFFEAGRWTTVRLELTSAHVRLLGVTTWSALDTVRATFALPLAEDTPLPAVSLRNVRVVVADGTCSSVPLPGGTPGDVFTAPTPPDALKFTPDPDNLEMTLDGPPLVLRPGANMDLSRFWDGDCGCLKEAYLRVVASFDVDTCMPSRIDIVDGTDAGVRIDVSLSPTDKVLRFGATNLNVFTAPISQVASDYLNSPDSTTFPAVSFVKVYRTGAATGESVHRMGNIYIHSVSVQHTASQCPVERGAKLPVQDGHPYT